MKTADLYKALIFIHAMNAFDGSVDAKSDQLNQSGGEKLCAFCMLIKG